LELLSALDQKERRKKICSLPKEGRPLTPEEWASAEPVSNLLDHIGVMIEQGLLLEDVLLEEMGEMVISMWDRLHIHIEELREGKHGRAQPMPRFQMYFQRLAERARKYEYRELK